LKFHHHVGVIEAESEESLAEALAIARCEGRVLAKLAPNVAVLEPEDAQKVIAALEERGLHPKVAR
jgi:hypothetical protein